MSEAKPTSEPSNSARRTARWAAVLCAVLPTLGMFELALISGRGSPVPILVVTVVVLVVLVSAIVLARRLPIAAGLGVIGFAALVAFRASFASHPIDPAQGAELVLPPTSGIPRGVFVHRIETGTVHRTAAFAHRGGDFDTPRTFAMNAVLVTHPDGDVLIDAGLSSNVDAHLAVMPLPFRALSQIERGESVDAQLGAMSYDRARLRAIVLTHAHWDHVSGAADLIDVPIHLPEAERSFLDEGWITAVARSLPRGRFHTYTFDDGPALDAPRSHDVYGDGAIVVVPAPGHTPGSVMVLVTDSDERRFLFVGDVVWQREGITAREERPWLTRLGDSDAAAVRARIAGLSAIAEAHPEITIVPSHDARAYEALAPLSELARPEAR